MNSENDRSSLTRFAWLSICAALVTICLKVVAYRLTGSVGLLSDAIESLVNLVGGIMALAMLTVAARPADEDHPYGHSKAEYFSSGVEGSLILLAAVSIGYTAVGRLIAPKPLEQVGLGLTVSVLASLVNLVVAVLLLRVGRKRNSITLEANAQHLLTDVWTSVGCRPGSGGCRPHRLAAPRSHCGTGCRREHRLDGRRHRAPLHRRPDGLGPLRRGPGRSATGSPEPTRRAGCDSTNSRPARPAPASSSPSTCRSPVTGPWSEATQLAGHIASDVRQALREASVITHLEPLDAPSPAAP